MEFNLSEDMKLVRELLGLSQTELAKAIGVKLLTVQRIENKKTNTSQRTLNDFYDFVFKKKIYLNKIKEMFYLEGLKDERLLFHGAKSLIEGEIDVSRSRKNNDFGPGFYCGESYEQSASFVENFDDSVIYYYAFDENGLKSVKYSVDRDWMLTIAYYRGKLNGYENHKLIKDLISRLEGVDYVIAPIADNRMFRIIDAFIVGEITDEQCMHCLAATSLGYQYVLLNSNAVSKLRKLECCFLSKEEREFYRNEKEIDGKVGDDKVKLARIKYRGKGRYIDELLK